MLTGYQRCWLQKSLDVGGLEDHPVRRVHVSSWHATIDRNRKSQRFKMILRWFTWKLAPWHGRNSLLGNHPFCRFHVELVEWYSLGLVLSLPSDASDATSDHPDYFAVFGACKDVCEQNLDLPRLHSGNSFTQNYVPNRSIQLNAYDDDTKADQFSQRGSSTSNKYPIKLNISGYIRYMIIYNSIMHGCYDECWWLNPWKTELK